MNQDERQQHMEQNVQNKRNPIQTVNTNDRAYLRERNALNERNYIQIGEKFKGPNTEKEMI